MAAPAAQWMSGGDPRPARVRRGWRRVTVWSWAFLRGRRSGGCGRGGSSHCRCGIGGSREAVPADNEVAALADPAPVSSRRNWQRRTSPWGTSRPGMAGQGNAVGEGEGLRRGATP